MRPNLRKFVVASALFVFAACSGSEPAPDAEDTIEEAIVAPNDATSEITTPQVKPGAEAFKIVMLGDSLTAGFELPPSQALPAEIERLLKSAGHSIDVINAGVSGDTSAGGLARYDWSVASANPDMLILALGANDYLGGIDPDQTKDNLTAIIERASSDDVEILLVSVSARSSAASDPRAAVFAEIYPDLAETYEIALYSGLVDPIFDQPNLLMQDGLHPTAEGIRNIAPPLSAAIAEFLKSN
ncbi:MAG: arylesterase [Pseudomonadota bacterium]